MASAHAPQPSPRLQGDEPLAQLLPVPLDAILDRLAPVPNLPEVAVHSIHQTEPWPPIPKQDAFRVSAAPLDGWNGGRELVGAARTSPVLPRSRQKAELTACFRNRSVGLRIGVGDEDWSPQVRHIRHNRFSPGSLTRRRVPFRRFPSPTSPKCPAPS